MAIKSTKPYALDSMVFIYFLDASDPNLHASSKIFIEPLLQGKSQAVTSIISVIETLSTPKYLYDRERVENYSLFFYSIPGLLIANVTWEIAQEAARLRRESAFLRTPDSIQLATALVNKADIFITNDARLKNLTLPDLKILPLNNKT